MSSSNDIDFWLKAASNSTVFQTMVPQVQSDTYPKAEHPTLAAATGIATDFLILVKFCRIDTNKVPAGHKREQAQLYKAASKPYLMLHRKSLPGPRREIELWWRAIVPTATQHVITMLTHLNLLDKQEKRLYSGDGDHISTVSMSIHDAAKLKLHSIVHTLVADSPLSPSEDEDTLVQGYCRGQLGLGDDDPTDANTIAKLQIYVININRSLARFRDILNHQLLYLTTILCHRETLENLKNLHSAHVRSNSALAEGEAPAIFTAQKVLQYLLDECSVSNDELINGYKIDVQKLYRKSKVTPLRWLRQFKPLIDHINNLSPTNLTKNEEQALWKKTWGRNLNIKEAQLLVSLKDLEAFSAQKWARIKKFRDGDFDEVIMEEFLTQTQTEFKPDFEPDNNVQRYNYEHYKQKKFDPKDIHYGPKRAVPSSKTTAHVQKVSKESKRASTHKNAHKRKAPHQPLPHRSAKLLQGGNLPPNLRCTNPFCIEKGIDVTHTTATCRNMNKSSSTTPVVHDKQRASRGKGKGKHTSNAGQRRPPSRSQQPTGKGRRAPCRLCGGFHNKGQCPVLSNRNANNKAISSRLTTSSQVQQRFQRTFYNAELQELASTVVAGYDLPNVCHTCLNPLCEGYCQPSQRHLDNVSHVMASLRDDPDLAQAVRDATHMCDQHDGDLGRSIMAPLNVESYFNYDPPVMDTDYGHEHVKDDSLDLPDIFSADAKFTDHDIEPSFTANSVVQEGQPDPEAAGSDTEHSAASHEEDSDQDVDDPFEEGEQITPSYFATGVTSEEHPDVLALDTHFGIEMVSPAYTSATEEGRRSLICECTAKVRLDNDQLVTADIKIDNCNARMLAGSKFIRAKKSCYEYGLPPVRMITASKEPTSWKRDAGLIEYFDKNGIKCTSLAYVDYDNPDLILMDLTTRLNAQVDEQYHAETSTKTGVQPLKRKTSKPYHYLDHSPEGTDPWRVHVVPNHTAKPLAAMAAEHFRRICRSFRRNAVGSTKGKHIASARKVATAAYICACTPRVVPAALADAYHKMQDRLHNLDIGEGDLSTTPTHVDKANV